MADLEAAERTIRLLNELLEVDPDAVNALIESRVPCNETLANHPTVQVSGYQYDDNPKPHAYKVGMLGILNGICGAYGPDAGDKEGWGPITAEFDEGKIVRFLLTKCVQCLNPHYDGICSCGGWGDEEVAKAAAWHEKNKPKLEARAQTRAIEAQKSLADHDASLTKPVKDLEKLWDR